MLIIIVVDLFIVVHYFVNLVIVTVYSFVI